LINSVYIIFRLTLNLKIYIYIYIYKYIYIYIYIYIIPKRVLAPKKVHTRSHPDPEPSIAIDNPEQLLKQKPLAVDSVSHISLRKFPYFSREPTNSQNLDLDTFPPRSLVRTRSETFVTGLVFDPTVLQPRTPKVLSPKTKLQITTSAQPSPPSSSTSVATSPTTQVCYTSKLLRWISVALSLSIVVSVASSLQLSQVSQVDH
jgi:hypothetical protein